MGTWGAVASLADSARALASTMVARAAGWLLASAGHGASEAAGKAAGGAEAAHAAGEAAHAAVHGLAPIVYDTLPVWLVVIPLVGALATYVIGRKSERWRDVLAVVTAGLTLLTSVALIPAVRAGHRIGCEIPVLVGRLTFTVDSFGMLFALFVSLVWFVSTLYSLDYMRHEHKRNRYHTVNLAVLATNLGVVLAGDLITLYLFFEALGLAAYLLVVHTETAEAKQASLKYLWMTVLGGFALVAGIFLAFAAGSNGSLTPMPLEEASRPLLWAAAALMIAGFGVKAGMVPLHIWLPDAHPVAPSPASALLSGVMIKAGAYGIFRTVMALFRPEVAEHLAEELWGFTGQLGLVVLWIGVVTMFTGVVLALLQENAKRMLAYHSVSQMGFILCGLGAAGYLGAAGEMGVAGGLMHVLNHALFKACLFLGVGAVYFRTGELDMYKLGGLARRMPLTFLFTLVAALGISGIPLFNGFVSKTLIHHALVEAAELRHLASLKVAEIIYIITCGGTACSFMKLIIFVFLGEPTKERPEVREAPARMLVAMGLLALPIVLIGVMPRLVLGAVFMPGLETWALHTTLLAEFDPFALKEFVAVLWAVGIGAAIFVVGVRFGLFHVHFPAWFSLDHWYRQGATGSMRTLLVAGACHDAFLQEASGALRRSRRVMAVWATRLRRRWTRVVVTLSTGAPVVRNEHFFEAAYVALSHERHAAVRNAVSDALDRLRADPGLDDSTREGLIESVRIIAAYMAWRLFRERMGVLGDLVKRTPAEIVAAALEDVLPELERFREPVARTAFALAEPRMHGVNVTRDISAAMNTLMGEERFDLLMKGCLPVPQAVAIAPVLSLATPGGGPSMARLRLFRAEGLTRLEKTGKWITDMARISVDALRQEHVPWLYEERPDLESVEATRRAIQRYVRDISFNVGVFVAMFLVLLVTLAGSG